VSIFKIWFICFFREFFMSIHNERSFIINHLIRHDFHARAGVSLSFQFFHYIKKKKKKKKKRHAKSLEGGSHPSILSTKLKKKRKTKCLIGKRITSCTHFLLLLLLYNRNAAELMIPCCWVDAYLPMNHRRKSLGKVRFFFHFSSLVDHEFFFFFFF
jgi:hypothetical protein